MRTTLALVAAAIVLAVACAVVAAVFVAATWHKPTKAPRTPPPLRYWASLPHVTVCPVSRFDPIITT